MLRLEEEPNDTEFRAALDVITGAHIKEDVGKQLQLVAELATSCPHSISVVRTALPDDERTFNYTCFQYAFDLVDPPQAIVDIARLYKHIYPSSEFVQYLTEQYLEEISPKGAVDGDVVVYLNTDTITHAGKLRSDRIVSKWGTAHLWQHRLFEIPLRYGMTVRFFRSISRDESCEAFMRYAEAKLGCGSSRVPGGSETRPCT